MWLVAQANQQRPEKANQFVSDWRKMAVARKPGGRVRVSRPVAWGRGQRWGLGAGTRGGAARPRAHDAQARPRTHMRAGCPVEVKVID